MKLALEVGQEEDGRWIAEVPQLPGILCYGTSGEEAMPRPEGLALRVVAAKIEEGEARPQPLRFIVPAA